MNRHRGPAGAGAPAGYRRVPTRPAPAGGSRGAVAGARTPPVMSGCGARRATTRRSLRPGAAVDCPTARWGGLLGVYARFAVGLGGRRGHEAHEKSTPGLFSRHSARFVGPRPRGADAGPAGNSGIGGQNTPCVFVSRKDGARTAPRGGAWSDTTARTCISWPRSGHDGRRPPRVGPTPTTGRRRRARPSAARGGDRRRPPQARPRRRRRLVEWAPGEHRTDVREPGPSAAVAAPVGRRHRRAPGASTAGPARRRPRRRFPVKSARRPAGQQGRAAEPSRRFVDHRHRRVPAPLGGGVTPRCPRRRFPVKSARRPAGQQGRTVDRGRPRRPPPPSGTRPVGRGRNYAVPSPSPIPSPSPTAVRAHSRRLPRWLTPRRAKGCRWRPSARPSGAPWPRSRRRPGSRRCRRAAIRAASRR
ncbi:hypothetical protein EKD16_05605 [Streptomonospora litoralis]|uniref:Uncharacterized protein n=1 Tax=Streptomonospora litoralis TaxID=2498135 RepID=A0A4P6Q2C8_9ACTN|nr:hypothetical protein EKD16_05605 [Streptomonospora litoralis]